MVFFGTLEEANNMYHISKWVNMLIALFDTVLLFSFLNLWLFGWKAFRVSFTALGILGRVHESLIDSENRVLSTHFGKSMEESYTRGFQYLMDTTEFYFY
jgi:hypothetical protein